MSHDQSRPASLGHPRNHPSGRGERTMKTEEILARPAKTLTREQREFYFENGYLLLPEFVSEEWRERLQAVTAQLIEESRTVTKSGEKFVVETGHTAASP